MAATVASNTATSVSAAGTTGITITKPSGVATGDVLYAFVSRTDFANSAAWTCGGWTDISPGTTGVTTQNDRQTTILRKVITNGGGEPANYTFVNTQGTTYQIVGIIVRVTGADTATPEDIAVPAYTFTTNDSTPASLDATSATDNALVLEYLQISLGTTATKTWGVPSTYTDCGNASETTGSLDNQCGVAYKSLGAAGSTAGTNVWTGTVDDNTSESLTAVVLVRSFVAVVAPFAPAVVHSQAIAAPRRFRIRPREPVVAPAALSLPGYYISNSGDDSKDGLSAANAWATLAKHNAASIASGATVYLDRGSVFRESLTPKTGVTYTAYGSGNKPSIRGSDLFTSSWTQDSGGATLTDVISAAGSDDGYFGQTGSDFFGTFNDLRTGDEGDVDMTVFSRMVLAVPNAATISSTTLKLRATANSSSSVSVEIYAVAADDAAAPTTAAQGQALSKTTAHVTWNPPTVTAGTDYTTPDISSVVQEVVNRAGWVSGNHITFLLVATAATWVFLDWRSFEHPSSDHGPRLTTTYTSGSAALWYKSSVSTDPAVFAHDGTLGQRKTTKAALTTQWDYWWDDPNDRFYVYSSADPSSLATTLEYGVRNRILNDYNGVDCTFDNLDVRHNRDDVVFGLFSVNNCYFTNCDFSQHGKYVIQYNNGSGGGVDSCTFTDWGVVNAISYAVQSIADGTPDALPLDIEDNTFTITHHSNTTEITASMCDTYGGTRKFNRNTCDATAGNWPLDMVVWYRQAPSTTSIECNDNVFLSPGALGINLTDLSNHSPASLTVEVARNTIRDACQEDRLDTEALRVRNFDGTNIAVTVHHNIIDSTVNGTNDHHGLRVISATNVKVYHNVFYGCDDGFYMDDADSARSPTATVKNNISSNNRLTAGHRVTGTLTETNNLWNGTRTGFTADATDVIDVSPSFVDAAGNDFHLTVGSPAINAGVAIAGINDGYVGSAPDIGVYETATELQPAIPMRLVY